MTTKRKKAGPTLFDVPFAFARPKLGPKLGTHHLLGVAFKNDSETFGELGAER